LLIATLTYVSTKVIGYGLGEIAPRPGAIGVYMNTTSLNNFVQSAIPVGAYFWLNNHTFELNMTESTTFYDLNLDSIHVIEATGFTEKEFKYLPNSEYVHLRIGGFNVSTLVEADFKALHLIPFRASSVNITNMVIDIKLKAFAMDDEVHWKIAETTKVSFDTVNIHMDSTFLNYLVRLSRPNID